MHCNSRQHSDGIQHAKKIVSDNPGLVDFAIGLVNSVFNLPEASEGFWGIQITKERVNNPVRQKKKNFRTS